MLPSVKVVRPALAAKDICAIAPVSKTYFELPESQENVPSCRLGSFFCFLLPSESAFGFLDSLLVFFSFDMVILPGWIYPASY